MPSNRSCFATAVVCSLALLLPLGAVAAEPEDLRALRAYLQRHVQPVSVIAQLEHCRKLAEQRAENDVVEGCFRYAGLIVREGLRLRSAAPRRSKAFEARLAASAGELASRLDAVSAADRERLAAELRTLDQAIDSLRVELLRVAGAEAPRISLVSRGGVSLGNWQAGFLYLLTEWAKSRTGRTLSEPAFFTVTGASAGAVNGLAAAVESCRGTNLSVEDSIYYQVWVGLGLFGRHGKPGLFPTAQGSSTALSLFTDDDVHVFTACSELGEKEADQLLERRRFWLLTQPRSLRQSGAARTRPPRYN